MEKLVAINRVAKVVKGGRRFGFSAIVVIGDGSGRAGFGTGKAREVPEAIRKATEQARRGMVRVPLRQGRTLHHDVTGRYGAGRVALRNAPPGTGIIAGGPMRAVFEVLGIQDVVAKSIGSSNPHNMVRATFAALANCSSPSRIAAKRGKKVAEVFANREPEARQAAARAAEQEAAAATETTEMPAAEIPETPVAETPVAETPEATATSDAPAATAEVAPATPEAPAAVDGSTETLAEAPAEAAASEAPADETSAAETPAAETPAAEVSGDAGEVKDEKAKGKDDG